MLQLILDNLRGRDDIKDWILTESRLESAELFFVRDRLDMNRRTSIQECELHVYVDFNEDGTAYTGDAVALIGPDDSPEEIGRKIDRAVFSAGLIRNPAYPLPGPGSAEPIIRQGFDTVGDLEKRFAGLHRLFFGSYAYQARVNSVEIFTKAGTKRTISSKGLDVTEPVSEFMFELVTDTDTGAEPVEIFRIYNLTSQDEEEIRAIVVKQLIETEGRATALPSPLMEHCRVIISGAEVEEFLFYYVSHATDSLVYQKVSRAALNERFVPAGAKQTLNIRMNPALASSPVARAVDDEGKILLPYPLYEDGVVKNFRTHARFSHYLGMPHIGFVSTFEAEGGECSLDDLRKDDYIEILAFSSFLMDTTTGDFGGEFRLARMVRGGEVSYITGGAISENISKAQLTMRFSRELQNQKCSRVPAAIVLEDVAITGKPMS